MHLSDIFDIIIWLKLNISSSLLDGGGFSWSKSIYENYFFSHFILKWTTIILSSSREKTKTSNIRILPSPHSFWWSSHLQSNQHILLHQRHSPTHPIASFYFLSIVSIHPKCSTSMLMWSAKIKWDNVHHCIDFQHVCYVWRWSKINMMLF